MWEVTRNLAKPVAGLSVMSVCVTGHGPGGGRRSCSTYGCGIRRYPQRGRHRYSRSIASRYSPSLISIPNFLALIYHTCMHGTRIACTLTKNNVLHALIVKHTHAMGEAWSLCHSTYTGGLLVWSLCLCCSKARVMLPLKHLNLKPLP